MLSSDIEIIQSGICMLSANIQFHITVKEDNLFQTYGSASLTEINGIPSLHTDM